MENLKIRRASEKDIPVIDRLLYAVSKVHSDVRPDLFKQGTKKYNDAELQNILSDDTTPVFVAEKDGKIVGSILCGHDGRRGCLYHVCVDEAYRRHGIGKAMVVKAMEALKAEQINKVCLIAFTKNDIGNAFWNTIGWTEREDLNYYDFVLNDANITAFNEQ